MIAFFKSSSNKWHPSTFDSLVPRWKSIKLRHSLRHYFERTFAIWILSFSVSLILHYTREGHLKDDWTSSWKAYNISRSWKSRISVCLDAERSILHDRCLYDWICLITNSCPPSWSSIFILDRQYWFESNSNMNIFTRDELTSLGSKFLSDSIIRRLISISITCSSHFENNHLFHTCFSH